jgi:hypothetical protein
VSTADENRSISLLQHTPSTTDRCGTTDHVCTVTVRKAIPVPMQQTYAVKIRDQNPLLGIGESVQIQQEIQVMP